MFPSLSRSVAVPEVLYDGFVGFLCGVESLSRRQSRSQTTGLSVRRLEGKLPSRVSCCDLSR